MSANFFQQLPLPPNQLHGSYDINLVILSFLVAVFASYIALDMAGRLRDINNTTKSSLLWLVGGAIAMGAGIWSMHFIGMLSFTIPGLTLKYSLFWTILSLFVAIFASAFALYILKTSHVKIEYYILGGIILGLAIASMHYTGMEGMLISLNIRYLPQLFFLSILIAIIASEAALWLAIKSNQVVARMRSRIKLVSAAIMGMAICGMHYTAMAASIFTPLCAPAVSAGGGLDPNVLAINIAIITFIILSVAFFASSYKEAFNQEQFEKARQLGMAEISASILHNVGNVLNSVAVSADILSEKNSSTKLSELNKLNSLFSEHQHDLPEFLEKTKSQLTLFITKLVEYWQNENKFISQELARLHKNIRLIKEIINTQQDLSKVTELEQVISVNDLINEALLITGLNTQKHIQVNKQYSKLQSIKADKVKLVQVLVNLFSNAKDAVMAAAKDKKIITITTRTEKNRIFIEIMDNGIGIKQKNLNKIFNYGFTTKKTGHGFGLHTSALAISSMGGKINVTSAGIDKGATFFIELPYKKP